MRLMSPSLTLFASIASVAARSRKRVGITNGAAPGALQERAVRGVDGEGQGVIGATPCRRAAQCFGEIFPAKVWVTIFPSFTTNVSVPSS